MKFNRLRLENWRNFLSVDVELQRRVFLVGPNAAGKSNILDAFRFLRDIADPQGGGPEGLSDPKQALVNLARESRSRTIVADMVPRPGLSADVGPAYTARISEFALQHWRPDIAAESSLSLTRCVERLRELAAYVYPVDGP